MRIEKHGNLFAVVDDQLGALFQTHLLASAKEFIASCGKMKTILTDYREICHTKQAVRYGRVINY